MDEVITKDILENEYLCNSLSETQIAEKYGTTRYFVSKLLKEYEINKNTKLNSKSTYSKVAQITKEKFTQLYLIENKSYSEIAGMFDITERQVKRLNVEKYHIHKDKKSISENIKNSLANIVIDYSSLAEKRKQTVISKYGVDNVFQSDIVKNKIKETNKEKYGTENPASNIEVRQKISDSLRKTFNKSFNREPELIETVSSKNKLQEFILSIDEKERTFYNIAKKLNYSVSYITHKIQEYDLSKFVKYQTTTSHYEDEIENYLIELGIDKSDIIRNSKSQLHGKDLDIFIKSCNVGIEFNGDYWHTADKVGKRYHYEKSRLAEDNGIRLVHIYEYQWNDPIKQLILKSIIQNALGLNKNKIYARKCEVRECDANDVREFSEINSLHGHRNATIYLGLYFNNELVEIMSFGYSFFARDKSIDYECIRSITKLGYTVVGGMNKLFNYFIKKYKPNKVLYYVDYNTHNGNSMSALGFAFYSYSKGGMINISRDKEVTEKYGFAFNRSPMNNSEMKKLAAEGKINTIYDAGIKKYIWENNKKEKN